MTRVPADWNLHGVVLRLDVKRQLFQPLHDFYAHVEALHSLH